MRKNKTDQVIDYTEDDIEFENNYLLSNYVAIERSINRSLYPNSLGKRRNFNDPKGPKTIQVGKIRNVNFKVIDYITTKLREKILTYQLVDNIDLGLFIPKKETIQKDFLDYYRYNDTTLKKNIDMLHKQEYFNLSLNSKQMLEEDPHFKRMFGYLSPSPRVIDELFTETSNILINTRTNILVRTENPKKNKYENITNLFEKRNSSELYERDIFPPSKLFNIETTFDKNQKRCRRATYNINFNTFLGTILMLNTYSRGLDYLPFGFYDLSNYAQYLYKFVILLSNVKNKKNLLFKSKTDDGIKSQVLSPGGFTYEYIRNRLGILDQNYLLILYDALNNLKEKHFILDWKNSKNNKLQIYFNIE